MEISGFNILVVLGAIAFVWLLPIIIIASSRKTSGGEKLAWLLAVLFVSWFAWIFYLLLAPIKKK
ncbi:MAG TPA: PLDc N-terminal domain-containing protein [Pelobium sp.]|nr:PLDc N-terminal domain-containing protein [Pelobium sp.]